MFTVRSSLVALAGASALAACGSGSASSPHFALQLSSSSNPVDDAAPRLEMNAGEVKAVILVALGASHEPSFSAAGLPRFATLDGPVLTLSPGRADSGDYTHEEIDKPRMGFDRGPCVGRQCACVATPPAGSRPELGACTSNLDCCSGNCAPTTRNPTTGHACN